jgi:hypothetical protein
MNQLLLSEQEILQRLDDDFADSNFLFDSLFLDCVPQFVIDANSEKWCRCHLDCLSDCTNFGIIQNISHSKDVFVTRLNDFVSSFTLNKVVIPHHQKVTTNITGELATIVCALMALITDQAFDTARFNHFLSFVPQTPELVSVYTGYSSVYTGASLVGGVSNG